MEFRHRSILAPIAYRKPICQLSDRRERGDIAAAHSIQNGLTLLDATHGEKVNVGTISQLVLEGQDDEFVEDYIDFSLGIDLSVTLADIGVEDPSRVHLDVVTDAACAANETIPMSRSRCGPIWCEIRF